MHLPEVGRELGLLVAPARHVGVRRDDLAPGLKVPVADASISEPPALRFSPRTCSSNVRRRNSILILLTSSASARRDRCEQRPHCTYLLRRGVQCGNAMAGGAPFSAAGGRCTEKGSLEFHHLVRTVGGEATIANLELRCRAHNAYEAERILGLAGCRFRPTNREAPCGAWTRSGPSSGRQCRRQPTLPRRTLVCVVSGSWLN